jgi:hypothetical protein
MTGHPHEPSTRRGRCRYCGRGFALTKAGRVRKHRIRTPPYGWCGGSGQVPS